MGDPDMRVDLALCDVGWCRTITTAIDSAS